MRALLLFTLTLPAPLLPGETLHDSTRPGWRCEERTGTTIEDHRVPVAPLIERNVCARWARED